MAPLGSTTHYPTSVGFFVSQRWSSVKEVTVHETFFGRSPHPCNAKKGSGNLLAADKDAAAGH